MASQHRVPVILTRPLAQAERFARSLPAGARPVLSPLLRIEMLASNIDLAAYDGLLFTSENGVHAFEGAGVARGRTAYCVGDRTAEAARVAGFEAISAKGTAEDLLALVGLKTPAGGLLHVHGRHVRVDLAARLSQAGIRAEAAELYDQVTQPLSREARDCLAAGRTVVPLFSPRSATLFADACPVAENAELVCLSSAVAAALGGGRYAGITTVSAPNAEAMLDEVSCRVTG